MVGKVPRRDYNLVYLGFHGSPENIFIGSQVVGLTEIAEIFGKRLKGKGIHFASCSVLNTDKEKISEFIEKTGVKFLSGYSQDIDYIEGSVMDLAFLGKWFQYSRIGNLRNAIEKSYGDFISENGFKFYLG